MTSKKQNIFVACYVCLERQFTKNKIDIKWGVGGSLMALAHNAPAATKVAGGGHSPQSAVADTIDTFSGDGDTSRECRCSASHCVVGSQRVALDFNAAVSNDGRPVACRAAGPGGMTIRRRIASIAYTNGSSCASTNGNPGGVVVINSCAAANKRTSGSGAAWALC